MSDGGDSNLPANISAETMKVYGETLGLAVADDVAKYLADEANFRLKTVAQDAKKFMCHGKRRKLTAEDIDHSLKMKNVEPIYGFQCKEHIPFRYASGGGRELFFTEEKELDLAEILNTSLPKLPVEPTLRAHWLSIEGQQPSIPENPAPVSKDQQKVEALDPANKQGSKNESKKTGKSVETVQIKQLATHEMSREQQMYYLEITEACVGCDESRRSEALQSLTCDPGLHQMVPRLCIFISEGVKVNVAHNNLALLIYLMRMVKALLDNQTLYLEKYLHELIPAVMSCIVSKQLCMRPEQDNHWALRDFASRLLAQICRSFHNSTNAIQTRITRVFCQAITNDKAPLASRYGAISGLAELGPEVIKAFILPRVKSEGERIMPYLEQQHVAFSAVDRTATKHIKNLFLKILPPVLKTVRNPPDNLEDYKIDYGYLGPALQVAVKRARTQQNSSGQAAKPGAPTVTSAAANSTRLLPGSSVQQPTRTYLVTGGDKPAQSTQKYVIVSSNQGGRSSPIPQSQQTVVKLNQSMGMGQHQGSKLIVVSSGQGQQLVKPIFTTTSMTSVDGIKLEPELDEPK